MLHPLHFFSFSLIDFPVEDVPDDQCNEGTPCVCDPSTQPSSQPSEVPSVSSIPSSQPSTQPSSQPSEEPSSSTKPSSSSMPSSQPSTQSSSQPSEVPSKSFVPSCSKCSSGNDVCGNTQITFDAEVGCGSCFKDFACAGASGIIGESSCFGFRACYQFGYTFATQEDTNGEGGKMLFARSLQESHEPIIPKDTDLENQPPIKVEGSSIGESSCLGESACDSASGIIGSSSCIGFNACSFVPFQSIKLEDGGEGEVSKFFTSFPKPIQGDFFHNEQIEKGKNYPSQYILPFTRSLLEEIQQPSIGSESCLGVSACRQNRGIIGDKSCTKDDACSFNTVRIGNDSW